MNGIPGKKMSGDAPDVNPIIGIVRKRRKSKHGLTRTSFYFVWQHMKNRCLNPSDKNFKDYGGRGIRVCAEWLVFTNFRDDMHDRYLKHREGHKTTTIDRINNDGNYEPNNCRWATRSEQNANSRAAKWFTAFSPDGEIFQSKDQTAFGREHNLQQSLINKVLRGVLPHHKQWKFKYAEREEM
jgi:hypothetical protein